VEEAAIDCKNITTQTTVSLPLSLKAGNGLSVKIVCILAREFAVSIKSTLGATLLKLFS